MNPRLESLPQESILKIFLHLDIEALKNICSNKHTSDLCNSFDFWKMKFSHEGLHLFPRDRHDYCFVDWAQEYEKISKARHLAEFLIYLIPKVAPMKRRLYGLIRIDLRHYGLSSMVPFFSKQVLDDIDDIASKPQELRITCYDRKVGGVMKSETIISSIVTYQEYDDVTVYIEPDDTKKLMIYALSELLSAGRLLVVDEDDVLVLADDGKNFSLDDDYYAKLYHFFT